ncbi:uncharacterized protein PAC_12305 [Phialocephala subalpina]|uniref:Heterokaryon incompatibility domain-containing protein n=1 Tax=Phialocephala subalpina TaxID=576137 RepID=A0A1L7XBK1_9HELO|nr:uncharacterized protein PAC_12305 [Phialocephala subalpina]
MHCATAAHREVDGLHWCCGPITLTERFKNPTSTFPNLNSSIPETNRDDAKRLPRQDDELEPDTITCTLHTADLDDENCCKYEALSYEWGDATNASFFISLEGRKFGVRENLWWALWHLRLENEMRVLWVGALCIDQGSVGERDHRVKQMAKVYSQATCVVAWLGQFEQVLPNSKGTCNVQQAKEYMQQFAEICKEHGEVTSLWCYSHTDDLLFDKRRIRHSLGWSVVHPESAWRTSLYKYLEDPENSSLQSLEQRHTVSKRLNLLDSAYLYREALCENLFDKVYGLLGVVPGCCRTSMEVNYDISSMKLLNILLRHNFSAHGGCVHWNNSSNKVPTKVEAIFASLGGKDELKLPTLENLPELLNTEVHFVPTIETIAVLECQPMRMEVSSPKKILMMANQKNPDDQVYRDLHFSEYYGNELCRGRGFVVPELEARFHLDSITCSDPFGDVQLGDIVYRFGSRTLLFLGWTRSRRWIKEISELYTSERIWKADEVELFLDDYRQFTELHLDGRKHADVENLWFPGMSLGCCLFDSLLSQGRNSVFDPLNWQFANSSRYARLGGIELSSIEDTKNEDDSNCRSGTVNTVLDTGPGKQSVAKVESTMPKEFWELKPSLKFTKSSPLQSQKQRYSPGFHPAALEIPILIANKPSHHVLFSTESQMHMQSSSSVRTPAEKWKCGPRSKAPSWKGPTWVSQSWLLHWNRL